MNGECRDGDGVIMTKTDVPNGPASKLSPSSTRSMIKNSGYLQIKIHPKGHGVVCNRQDGLPAGEFVNYYLGELYPPWRWFEKQDAVKSVLFEKLMP